MSGRYGSDCPLCPRHVRHHPCLRLCLLGVWGAVMLPPILSTFFAKRKPRITDTAFADQMGRIITRTQEPELTARDKPETVEETKMRDMLERADRYRKAQGDDT